jgi:hypothetical protein
VDICIRPVVVVALVKVHLLDLQLLFAAQMLHLLDENGKFDSRQQPARPPLVHFDYLPHILCLMKDTDD